MNPTTKTAMFAASIALGMTGLGYASVPLYRLFCQITGIDGTTGKDIGGTAPGAVIGKNITIRFDANHVPALPWNFAPEDKTTDVTIGAREMAFYSAKNLSGQAITGTATFNVTPVYAAKYFTKIQCFCFNEQTLKPGEQVRMPVIYYVDPAILDDPQAREVEEITLSYTFYPVDAPGKAS
jgi:cytochrome c oxidase assembly protein subunit 11